MDEEELRTFRTFVAGIFPNLAFEGMDRVGQQAISETLHGRGKWPLIRSAIEGPPLQGDIVGPLPFSWIDENGDQVEYESHGLVLSATCDVENDDLVSVCVCIPGSTARQEDIINEEVEAQRAFRLMFLSGGGGEFVADFARIMTIPSRVIGDRLARSWSLTQFGYYMFLTKLTVHFMRPEAAVARSDF